MGKVERTAKVVERLAADLRMEFPGVGGFSRRNIFYMREFYLAYRDLPKVQPLVAQIGWTHNLIVVQRCREPLEREFYIRMTKKFGWTKNVLTHQIENQSYMRVFAAAWPDSAIVQRAAAQIPWLLPDEYKVSLPTVEEIVNSLDLGSDQDK